MLLCEERNIVYENGLTVNGFVCPLCEAEENIQQLEQKTDAMPDLLDAVESALGFINSMKDCIPDWQDRMKVGEEGYTGKLKKAIDKARGED